MNERLILFDIDGTLLPGQSQFHLIRALRDEGEIPLGRALLIYLWFFLYRFGLVSDPKSAMEFALRFMRGKSVEATARDIDVFFEKKLRPMLYKDALRAIDGHRSRGERLILVSNAIAPLARCIGAAVGAADVIATELEVKDGRYTGALLDVPVYGEHKKKKVEDYAAKRNLSLAGAWAYADHASDIPVLKLAEHPVAVNPDRILFKTAVTMGWKVLRFTE